MKGAPLVLRATHIVIAWNTLVQLVGRAISAVVMLVITILLARRFGATSYGDFVKITTFVGFFYPLADFGLNAMFLKRGDDWSVLLGARLFGGLAFLFVSLAALAFLPHGTIQGYTPLVRLGILVLSPTIIFQALTTSANALFQKHLRYELATVAVAAGSLAALVLMWLTTSAATASAGTIGGVMAIFTGSAITALASVALAARLHKGLSVALRPSRMWGLFASSSPLGATLVFNLVYFHVDSIILALSRPTAEVGIYGLAYKIFELPLVIPTFFMNAAYPIMVTAIQNKNNRMRSNFISMVHRSLVFLVLISFFFSVGMWLAAPLLALIKPDFSQSVPAFRVLSSGFVLFFVSSLTMWSLIALNKTVALVLIYGGGMIVNAILNALLVPLYGYMAAAWITVGSEAIVLMVSAFVLRRYMRVPLRGEAVSIPKATELP